MIAVDTNVLVHAHRADSPFNARAFEVVRTLATGSDAWAIPWPCIHETFNIITHPRIWLPPSSTAAAAAQIDAWLASPSLVLLGEAPTHWDTLRALALAAKIAGPAVHDARVAALCVDHGVKELWTADRDFSRFPRLRVKHPLVA